MKIEEIQKLVITAIQEVAPEIEQTEIDPDGDIREECDLDSMDFFNYLIALKHATGVSIVETDFPKVNTLNAMCRYLDQKLP